MKLYDELQLNQAGSKKIISECTNTKAKCYHLTIYLLKIFLTVGFCFIFVTAFSLIFGNENSIVGVVVLLYLLVFRNANLTIQTNQSILLFILFFIMMAITPHLASHTSPLLGLVIHLFSIGLLVVLGCHEPLFYNQSTLVLSYLLLYGYPVTGLAYQKRVIALMIGCLIICTVFYFKNHKKTYKQTISSILKAFDLKSSRTRWQLCQIACVSLSIFILECFHIQRSMWGGIAAMSIISPDLSLIKARASDRIIGTILGLISFTILYYTLNPSIYTYVGILGGIGVGLSATYKFQALFNTFGALAIATNLYGLTTALGLRLFTNVFAIGLSLLFLYFYYLPKKAQN